MSRFNGIHDWLSQISTSILPFIIKAIIWMAYYSVNCMKKCRKAFIDASQTSAQPSSQLKLLWSLVIFVIDNSFGIYAALNSFELSNIPESTFIRTVNHLLCHKSWILHAWSPYSPSHVNGTTFFLSFIASVLMRRSNWEFSLVCRGQEAVTRTVMFAPPSWPTVTSITG